MRLEKFIDRHIEIKLPINLKLTHAYSEWNDRNLRVASNDLISYTILCKSGDVNWSLNPEWISFKVKEVIVQNRKNKVRLL